MGRGGRNNNNNNNNKAMKHSGGGGHVELQHHRTGHLFLPQLLHPVLLHVVHETGPVGASAVPSLGPGAGGRLRGARGRVVPDGARAAVAADAEALQALRDVTPFEGSPAALAHERHVVTVTLYVGKEGRKEGREGGGKVALVNECRPMVDP